MSTVFTQKDREYKYESGGIVTLRTPTPDEERKYQRSRLQYKKNKLVDPMGSKAKEWYFNTLYVGCTDIEIEAKDGSKTPATATTFPVSEKCKIITMLFDVDESDEDFDFDLDKELGLDKDETEADESAPLPNSSKDTDGASG